MNPQHQLTGSEELEQIFSKERQCGTMPIGIDGEEDVHCSLADILSDNFESDVASKLRQELLEWHTKHLAKARLDLLLRYASDLARAVGYLEGLEFTDARLKRSYESLKHELTKLGAQLASMEKQ